ncbi:MAG: hypothetical protein NXI31_19550 [bacterium]|nr:hypothetical protein [bacterium]
MNTLLEEQLPDDGLPDELAELVLEMDLEDHFARAGSAAASESALQQEFAVPRHGSRSRVAIALGALATLAVLAIAWSEFESRSARSTFASAQDPVRDLDDGELFAALAVASTRDLAVAHLARRDAATAVRLLDYLEQRPAAPWRPAAYRAIARMPATDATRTRLMQHVQALLAHAPSANRATAAVEALHAHHLLSGPPADGWGAHVKNAFHINNDALRAGHELGSLAFENAVASLMAMSGPPAPDDDGDVASHWEWVRSPSISHARAARAQQVLMLAAVRGAPEHLVQCLTGPDHRSGHRSPIGVEASVFDRRIAPAVARALLASAATGDQRDRAHGVLLDRGDVLEQRAAVRTLAAADRLGSVHRTRMLELAAHPWAGIAREAIVALPLVCERGDLRALGLLQRIARRQDATLSPIAERTLTTLRE